VKVLLTGANGFLGRHVLGVLRQQGIQTVMLGRTRPPDGAFAEFIQADLLARPHLPSLVKAAGASHLLHLAWYVEHGKYWASPLNSRWVDASTRLVEAFCQSGGQQVVVAGSCAEYDWASAWCREDHTPLVPATLYGTAKDATRRLVMAVCAQHGVACAWGRVFLPFGSGESAQRLIPSLINVFQGLRPPFGVNGSAFRDFLHASDVAHGLVTLLLKGADGAYNVSSGEPVQLAEVVRELARQLQVDPEPVLAMSEKRLGEPTLLVGENLKIQSLGWQPALSLVQGLTQTVGGVQK
jgi:nucleoside-diphosphate-sugar epimerase